MLAEGTKIRRNQGGVEWEVSLWENGGGNPRTLEDPKGTGVEASGCAGGIWWGKDERLGCSLGTKLGALREQRVLRVQPRSHALSFMLSCHFPR